MSCKMNSAKYLLSWGWLVDPTKPCGWDTYKLADIYSSTVEPCVSWGISLVCNWIVNMGATDCSRILWFAYTGCLYASGICKDVDGSNCLMIRVSIDELLWSTLNTNFVCRIAVILQLILLMLMVWLWWHLTKCREDWYNSIIFILMVKSG